MRSISALSLAPDARSWLAKSHDPRILHVFDHACNLINEHHEVLSVVTLQVGNGPFNIVVKQEISFSDALNFQSAISVSASQLKLGNLTVPLAKAEIWSPKPDWEKLHARRVDIRNRLTELPITNYFKHTGFGCLGLNHQDLSNPQSLLFSLSHAIANAEIPASRAASQKLAGLGIGLTPAGDDILMGAIYAAWIIHPPEVGGALAKVIAETAASLTTSLSAAWLRSAAKGEAGTLWHELFAALNKGDKVTIQSQITKILSIGHTSGVDALVGFCSVFSSSSTLYSTCS